MIKRKKRSSFGGNQGGYGDTGAPHGGVGSGATKPVTAPNEIIIDPSFENNKCLYEIYKQIDSREGEFKNILNEFDKKTSIADLELKVATSSKFGRLL